VTKQWILANPKLSEAALIQPIKNLDQGYCQRCRNDAFFLESGFLALLLFGWHKIGPRMHFFSTCMVALGTLFSAMWILVANSWMQTPGGYHLVSARGYPSDGLCGAGRLRPGHGAAASLREVGS
jgi:hypothetical protein